MQATIARESERQSFLSPVLLYCNRPHVVSPSSLLYSQGSIQILVAHPDVSLSCLPYQPPSLLTHLHSLVSVHNTQRHILPDLQWAHLAESHAHSHHTLKNQRRQKKPKNRIPTEEKKTRKTRYQHL